MEETILSSMKTKIPARKEVLGNHLLRILKTVEQLHSLQFRLDGVLTTVASGNPMGSAVLDVELCTRTESATQELAFSHVAVLNAWLNELYELEHHSPVSINVVGESLESAQVCISWNYLDGRH